MTKLTKLALEQKNAALAADNAALRQEVEDLKLRLEMARAPRPVIRQLSSEAQHIVDARLAPANARLEAMRAAREIAMATGRVVKV